MVDRDGYLEYSKTIPVRFNSKLTGRTWLLNAFSLNKNVRVRIMSDRTQQVQFAITDVTGKTLFTQKMSLQTGSNQTDFKLPYAKGIYFIRMENGSEKIEPLAFYLQ